MQGGKGVQDVMDGKLYNTPGSGTDGAPCLRINRDHAGPENAALTSFMQPRPRLDRPIAPNHHFTCRKRNRATSTPPKFDKANRL